MDLNDFVHTFNELTICRVINTNMLTTRKTWSESKAHGKWIKGAGRDGGSSAHATFFLNPQYLFDINVHTDKPDDVMFNIDQLNVRFVGEKNLKIGFAVMRVEDNRTYRLNSLKPTQIASPFVEARSVFLRRTLTAGRYVLIPSTSEPGFEGHFFVRMYSEQPCNMRELVDDHPYPCCTVCNPFAKYPQCVTSLTIKGAKNLSKLDQTSLDTYVFIRCENETFTGRVVKSSSSPDWNTSAVFFRYYPNKPIKVEVWQKNLLIDKIYGEVSLEASPNNETTSIEYEINASRNDIEAGVKPAGTLLIELISKKDIKGL